ncbi:MAG: heavy metal translocating P-type ATPase [Phycisphaeraceae bacterium]|nr:heavy metal translocating P-type ATPase [Phycisphaeraceae bacterium]
MIAEAPGVVAREPIAIDAAQVVERVPCSHCGLPVPRGLVDREKDEQFCCEACRTVHGVLHACGLDGYYRLRDRLGAEPRRAQTSGGRFEAWDDPIFLEHHARRRADGAWQAELYLEGVHCAACVWLVERLPGIVEGLIECRLDLSRSLVRVVWQDRLPFSRIARALDRLGYTPHPARAGEVRAQRARENGRFLARIAAAGALAGNVMLLSLALYSGVFSGIEESFRVFFRWSSAALGLTAILWPGRIFFRGALASIRVRAWHLDVPIALGLALGGAAGAINTLRGAGEIYFDSLTMLVFLLLVGRWLQRSRQQRAADAVEMLTSLTPSTVRLVEGECVREAPLEAAMPGMILEVLAGGTIPVDGVVVSGESSADESVMTGESRPRRLTSGSSVIAGAINLSAPVRVRAIGIGDETRLGKLLGSIEPGGRRVGVAQVDRIAGAFVTATISLALVTLAIWLPHGVPLATEHAIALLIVTCPCALALASPMAVAIALARASRRAIFIKSGEAIQRLATPGLLLLDKTGTLTEGGLRVVRWIGDPSVRPLVAALEAGGTHPIARGLGAGFDVESLPSVSGVVHIVGRGVEGVVAGRSIRVGSCGFVAETTGRAPQWAEHEMRAAAEGMLSPVLVGVEGEVVAVALLGDRVRDDASESLRALVNRGWRLGIASGDDPRIVDRIARSVGVPFEHIVGGATPQDKAGLVERCAVDGPVVFVGDGVNDAAALSRATVGIAVHGGAEASLAAADVYLTRPGLGAITELFDGAVRTRRVIRTNIGASLVYNSVAASLAMAGLITPWIGAILMPLSSLTILTLSVHARTFGGRP